MERLFSFFQDATASHIHNFSPAGCVCRNWWGGFPKTAHPTYSRAPLDSRLFRHPREARERSVFLLQQYYKLLKLSHPTGISCVSLVRFVCIICF